MHRFNDIEAEDSYCIADFVLEKIRDNTLPRSKTTSNEDPPRMQWLLECYLWIFLTSHPAAWIVYTSLEALGKTQLTDYAHIYQTFVGRAPVVKRPEDRKRTNIIFLVFFVVCIAALIPLLTYTLYHSDFDRNGRNDECSGQNRTQEQIVECLQKMPCFRAFFWKITIISFIPLNLCLILAVLFKNAAAVAVWGVVILSWSIFPAAGLFFIFTNAPIGGLILILAAALLLCVMIFARENIGLATAHLREATKAIFDVRTLRYYVIGTLLVLLVVLLIQTIITFYITIERSYVTHVYMEVTEILVPVTAIWVAHFVLGIRDMVTSGAVTKWYSTKNKENLKDALSTSLRVALKNHLGTAALASILDVIMLGPRIVLGCLAQATVLHDMVDCWRRHIDGFFSGHLYIMTAIYGTSFVQSGKKAARLVKLSLGDTKSINSSANLVLVMAQILIGFVSLATAYFVFGHSGLEATTAVYGFSIEIAVVYICTNAILGSLKVASQTVFFCATEESLNNKEAQYPYNMTTKELAQGANRIFMNKVGSRTRPVASTKSVCLTVFSVIFLFCASCMLFVGARTIL